jgi:ribosomal protein L30E
MSIKEIKEAIQGKKAIFGIKQVLKSKKKFKKVFISKDTREETKQKLINTKIDFETLKSKKDLTKELELKFETEIIAIK